MIGHQTVYEKRAADGKTIISSKTVPVSSSNNHAMALTKNFNEVLYFQSLGGTTFKISASGGADLVAGSRVLEPSMYDWNKCPPSFIFNRLGIVAPENPEPNEAFRWYAAGDAPEIVRPNIGLTASPKLEAGNATQISAGVTKPAEDKQGFNALFAKKS